MTKDELEQDNETWQPLSLSTRRLLEACELSVKRNRGCGISSPSLFFGGEATQMNPLPVLTDPGAPGLPIGSKDDTFEAGCVSNVLRRVRVILAMGSFTQIDQAIIHPIHVDMIDQTCRPTTVDVKPSQAMGTVGALVYSDCPVLLPLAASYSSFATTPVHGYFPSENAGVRVVIEEATKLVNADEIIHLSRSEDHEGDRKGKADHQNDETDKQKENRAYIDQGLRKIALFEERASGKAVRTRRK